MTLHQLYHYWDMAHMHLSSSFQENILCSIFFAGVFSSNDPHNLRNSLKNMLILEMKKFRHRKAKLLAKD